MVVVIHDLGLAAYLKAIKGKQLAKLPYRDERGRFCFEFDLTPEEKQQYVLEYYDSQFRNFDNEVKALKKTLSQL